MGKLQTLIAEKPWVAWVLFLSTLVIVFLIGVFGASIVERRAETRFLFSASKPIKDFETRNEV